MSKGALLGDQHRPFGESMETAQRLGDGRGVGHHLGPVMWWTAVEAAGILRPGLTSMSKSSPSMMRPFTTRTAAIWQDLVDLRIEARGLGVEESRS